jgi:hypothetical protein
MKIVENGLNLQNLFIISIIEKIDSIMLFFCSYGCTAGVRMAGVVRRGGGPAPPLVRVGCSRTIARHHTLSDDPHVDADTPAVDSEVCNSYLLFISISLQ